MRAASRWTLPRVMSSRGEFGSCAVRAGLVFPQGLSLLCGFGIIIHFEGAAAMRFPALMFAPRRIIPVLALACFQTILANAAFALTKEAAIEQCKMSIGRER